MSSSVSLQCPAAAPPPGAGPGGSESFCHPNLQEGPGYAPARLAGSSAPILLTGSGFVLVEGDAVLADGSCFEGVLVVLGDLVCRSGRIDGSVCVRGAVRIRGDVRLSGTLYALGGLDPRCRDRLRLEGRLWTPGAPASAAGGAETGYVCSFEPAASF
jgi:hypothetical protein